MDANFPSSLITGTESTKRSVLKWHDHLLSTPVTILAAERNLLLVYSLHRHGTVRVKEVTGDFHSSCWRSLDDVHPSVALERQAIVIMMLLLLQLMRRPPSCLTFADGRTYIFDVRVQKSTTKECSTSHLNSLPFIYLIPSHSTSSSARLRCC